MDILAPGHNCWRIEQADRAALLIDAAPYFEHLEICLRQARRSVLIIGWDFDGRIPLCPQKGSLPLGELLREAVERNAGLEVRILVWSVGVVHGPGAALPMLIGTQWQKHPRIQVKLDTQHPLYGAHHQKIVTIDDAIAFSGGIDLTIQRWDTADHRPDHPLRRSPDGTAYGPVHDLQMAISGRAARAIADLARQRWCMATGERLSALDAERDLWPKALPTDFCNIPVAIVRTAPAWDRHHGAREAAKLTLDALKAATRLIYIEAQYLTASSVGMVLMNRLMDPGGPEIIIIVTKSSHSPVEQFIMGENRDRLLRKLRKADKYGRLRVYYPATQEGGKEHEILVHAKLIIVDDRFIKVGSSNLNNRSMGLDTECDVAIEATRKEDRTAIVRLMHTLLSEHLCASLEDIAEAAAGAGSLAQTIDALNGKARCLRELQIETDGPTRPVFGTALLDPGKPLRPSMIFGTRHERLLAAWGYIRPRT